jgi:hypothetical protein
LDETHWAVVDAGFAEMINDLGKALCSVRGRRKGHAALSEFEVIGDIAHDAF